ncbi:hypothetical protein CDAR_586651 [Caerostris darwini]|uniref:Period n=1 Tax=Caerostris darwini TaxID=1538125 RepID=A0AAV4TNZ9_9ARAC|nr:hypothetical protein CDAR_586651 [Caerostris darwini]
MLHSQRKLEGEISMNDVEKGDQHHFNMIRSLQGEMSMNDVEKGDQHHFNMIRSLQHDLTPAAATSSSTSTWETKNSLRGTDLENTKYTICSKMDL